MFRTDGNSTGLQPVVMNLKNGDDGIILPSWLGAGRLNSFASPASMWYAYGRNEICLHKSPQGVDSRNPCVRGETLNEPSSVPGSLQAARPVSTGDVL